MSHVKGPSERAPRVQESIGVYDVEEDEEGGATEEDERDAAIARERLAEIDANPGSVIKSAALEEKDEAVAILITCASSDLAFGPKAETARDVLGGTARQTIQSKRSTNRRRNRMPDKKKKPGKKPEPVVCIEKEFRPLPVELTKAELEDFGRRIGEAVENKKNAVARKQSAMATFRNEIGGFEDEIEKLAVAMNKKAEERAIECHWKYDLPHNEATLTRSDMKGPSAVVLKRTLRVDEIAELRSPGLPLKGGKDGDKKLKDDESLATFENVCTNLAGCGKPFLTKPGEVPPDGLCPKCVKEREAETKKTKDGKVDGK